MLRMNKINAALRTMQAELEPNSEEIAEYFNLTSEEENCLVDLYTAALDLEAELQDQDQN